MKYAVRNWRRVGSEDKHTDELVDASDPETAAQHVADSHGDKVTFRWGPHYHLHPPILFALGCNSDSLGSPNMITIEVYDPSALPLDWKGPTLEVRERDFLRHQIELSCQGTPLQPHADFAGAHLTPVAEKAILDHLPLTKEMIELSCQGTPLEEQADFAGPYLRDVINTYLENWPMVCQLLALEEDNQGPSKTC